MKPFFSSRIAVYDAEGIDHIVLPERLVGGLNRNEPKVLLEFVKHQIECRGAEKWENPQAPRREQRRDFKPRSTETKTEEPSEDAAEETEKKE